MSVHTLKDWVIATRPWSFPASTMPVAVTMAYCYYRSSAGMAGPITSDQWIYSVLALLSMILFQAAGNTWSDLHDFRHGVDTAADNFSVKILT
ncbi:MAG: prenyltransferase, partial [Muribaculaceae bacterium]|nr:prenyltransferase [Muribaculaceae bacterium]